MLKYIKRLLLFFTLTLLLAAGCTDRGTNVVDKPTSQGGFLDIGHDFTQELLLQIGRNVPGEDGLQRVPLELRGYTPEIAITPIHGGQPKLVPLLILLAPQDGNQWYFFNHNLKQLADELIAEGVIQPMEIICFPSDRFFGGYFYAGHSAAAGYYDFFIGGSLIEYLHSTFPFLTDSLPVGIGGVGMGGYGAFRAALMHRGVFSSISATDGPLDFDGPDGNSGFMELFDDAIIEQGLLGGTTEPPTYDSTWECDVIAFDTLWWVCDSLGFDTLVCDSVPDTLGWVCDSFEVDTLGDTVCVDSTAVIDTICAESTFVVDTFCARWIPIISDTVCVESTLFVDTTWPPSWRENFDSSSVWNLSRLFIGGALAFSPHDTVIDTAGIVKILGGGTYWEIDIPDSQRFTIDDSITLITEIVKENQFNFDFHLPFDSNGQTYDLIWNMWLENNLENILADSVGALDDVKMWIATTPEFSFGNYRQQTLSWIETLRNNGFDSTQFEVMEYTGYPGNPATNGQYLYDIMREMLIFHSKVFQSMQ